MRSVSYLRPLEISYLPRRCVLNLISQRNVNLRLSKAMRNSGIFGSFYRCCGVDSAKIVVGGSVANR
jgi:hypothetical protein